MGSAQVIFFMICAKHANFGLSEQYVTLIIKMPVYASLKQWIYNFRAFIAKLVCQNFAQKFGSSNPPAQNFEILELWAQDPH
jgi:hypothetical protein